MLSVTWEAEGYFQLHPKQLLLQLNGQTCQAHSPSLLSHFHFGEATQSWKQIPSCANAFHVEYWELPEFILSGTSTHCIRAQCKFLSVLQSRFQCSKTSASSKSCRICSTFLEQSLSFSESISINIAVLLYFWTQHRF